eukprot:COSAG02_NODE_6712_length_3406_cov_4.420321_1_plen_96_part_10
MSPPICYRREQENGKLTGGCVPPQSFLTTNAARFLRKTTRRRDASTLARFGTLQRDGWLDATLRVTGRAAEPDDRRNLHGLAPALDVCVVVGAVVR